MRPPFDASTRAGRAARSSPAPLQADMLRAALLAERAEHAAQLAQHSARFAALTNSSDGPTSLERAMAALHMYCARDAIEGIENALVRIEDVDVVPQARTCAGYPRVPHR